MKSLVGYTGFVGSNIVRTSEFIGKYNSSNIKSAYNTNPDLLVYAGLRAEKFLANKEPKKDLELVEEAIKNIESILPKKLVLISTIDVYKQPFNVDEDSPIDTQSLQPYGHNRFLLEEWVEHNIKDYLIVRLPGLYGENIKKNFIYDMIHYIPKMLNEKKFNELISKQPLLKNYYEYQSNGFYICKKLKTEEILILKELFSELNFSALNFTDSRGVFQFYNLKFLWKHIEIALENKINKLNLSTEPIKISELYRYIYNKDFTNEIFEDYPKYDFRTKYGKYFSNSNYIFDKNFILNDIKKFVEANINESINI